MRLERRIPLLLVLSVLLPVLLGNYSRLVIETRVKLGIEGQRGMAFARYVVTSSAPRQGTLNPDNVGRFQQEYGLITVEIVDRDGVIRAADREARVGRSVANKAEIQLALSGIPVSRIVADPALDESNGRELTRLDYLLLRPFREETAHDIWMAVPGENGAAPTTVFHARARLDWVMLLLTQGFKVQLALMGCVVGLVVLSLRWALARWVERPLAELGRVAARVAAGDRSARAPVGADDAIGRISRSFNAMTDALVTTEREADQDSVVGLLNQRALHRALDRTVEQAAERGQSLALLLLDLDDFKVINDTWGHQAGDRVLQEVGEALLRHTRRSDIVGRYGGDEFLVILPDTGRAGAHDLLERIWTAIRAIRLPDLAGDRPLVGVSIGCAVYAEDATTAADLIAQADNQLYAMKGAGRVIGRR